MAPTNNSAKVLQQNRPRPAVPRAIIPAIPLPYVQKRQRQQAAAAVVTEKEVLQTPTPVLEVVEEPPSASPENTEPTPNTPNGSSDDSSIKTEEVDHECHKETSSEPTEVEEAVEQAEEAVEPVHEETNNTQAELSVEDIQEAPKSTESEAPSESTRSTYQMPPPFVPVNQLHQPNATKPPPPNLSFNGHNPMHHAHPSSGSLMFGGYPESNNSSPAPPPSVGNVPAYPPFPLQYPQLGGGRHAPQLSNGGAPQPTPNGYSPMGPPPGYYNRQDGIMNQGPTAEFGRRYPLGSVNFNGPPDSYSPSATPLGVDPRAQAYDPSTPHSLQGSQSSAHADQDYGQTYYNQYPPAALNGINGGQFEDMRLYQQPHLKRNDSQLPVQVPNFPNHLNGQPPLPVDHFDGLVNYLQSQFADPSLADFTLELRYSDDRAPPVRIPGHSIIFARSPTLKNLMEQQQQSDGLTVRTLLLESDDRFLRSDSFWMAVQRLYGGPLLDLGIFSSMNNSPTTQSYPQPGSPADRFDLALGYAASGQILQIPPVISRGVEIANQFIHWNTIAKALDFGLEAGFDPSWLSQNGQVQERGVSTYGSPANVLLQSAMNFLVTSFPAGFKLDTSVMDAASNPRLPAVLEGRPSGHNPRLSFIKFGDHTSEEAARDSPSNPLTIVLSKILLNLPFPLLKYVLESSRLGNVQGWATTTLRQEVMHTVIEEREKRRIKVHSSSIPNTDRRHHAREWDAVGWQETVQSLNSNEASPTLARTWVEFTTREDGS